MSRFTESCLRSILEDAATVGEGDRTWDGAAPCPDFDSNAAFGGDEAILI